MSDFLSRVASAPISWGICEVPGWGAMLPTPRVLAEMSGMGMTATEFGTTSVVSDAPSTVFAVSCTVSCTELVARGWLTSSLREHDAGTTMPTPISATVRASRATDATPP